MARKPIVWFTINEKCMTIILSPEPGHIENKSKIWIMENLWLTYTGTLGASNTPLGFMGDLKPLFKKRSLMGYWINLVKIVNTLLFILTCLPNLSISSWISQVLRNHFQTHGLHGLWRETHQIWFWSHDSLATCNLMIQ